MLSKFIKLLYDNYNDISYNLLVKNINYDKAIKNIDIKHIDNPNYYINKEFNKLKYENIIIFKIIDYDMTVRCY